MVKTRQDLKNIFFINVAVESSKLSTCRVHVGAVFVKDNRIIATGYNGSIGGLEHCTDVGCLIVDNHCLRTVHAEQNAILDCAKRGVSCAGATAYVTHFPCINCTKILIGAGITSVLFLNDYKNNDNFFSKMLTIQKIDNGNHD